MVLVFHYIRFLSFSGTFNIILILFQVTADTLLLAIMASIFRKKNSNLIIPAVIIIYLYPINILCFHIWSFCIINEGLRLHDTFYPFKPFNFTLLASQNFLISSDGSNLRKWFLCLIINFRRFSHKWRIFTVLCRGRISINFPVMESDLNNPLNANVLRQYRIISHHTLSNKHSANR